MIKTIAFVAFVATLMCALAPQGVEGQLRNSCTSARPYRCPNGTCVATSSLCNINPCTGTTPYQCSDGTCQVSAIYCNCNGTVCWDGSCKSAVTECPLLPQCPEEFPQRCPNGECVAFNVNCTAVNKQGTPCPNGLVLCIDGICRSSDICIDVPYSGCPNFQCADGQCALTWSPCQCASPVGSVRCYDGTCMPVGNQTGMWPKCAVTAPAFINPNNVTATTDTSSSTSFTTTQSTSTTPVVTVSTSSGALTGTSSAGTGYSKRQVDVYIDNIWVRPVATPTTIYSVTEDDAGNWFNVTIASPIASITSELGQVLLNAGKTIALRFHNVYIAEGQEYCVAWLDQSTPEGTWRCVANSTIENSVETPNGVFADVVGEATRLGIFAAIKKEVYRCVSACPELPCDAVVYDLKTADGTVTVGTLTVNNKMDIEMQFEVNLYEDRYNSAYGWKLTGLRIEVGSKVITLDYSSHSANYREFTTIQMRDAYPGNTGVCQTDVPFFVSISVQDDGPCPNKRSEPTCPPVYRVVYPVARNKRTAGPVPPSPSAQERLDHTQNHRMCCTCAYRAELISNLGRTCAQVSTGCYRDAKFPRSYPYGITVGCATGYTMKWSNSSTVQRFLDRFENQWNNFGSVLSQNYEDFTGTTPAGQFAGYVVSMSLNDRFDRLDINFAESCNFLRNLYLCGGRCAPFQGMTIGELLTAANDVLGGCASTTQYNPNDMVTCFDEIERTFDKGRRLEHFRNRGFDIVPCA